MSHSQSHPAPNRGPPYAPTAASLGGIPRVRTDVPPTAVFLALFLAGAVANMTILQLNRRRAPPHKFLLSGLLFGFCMARAVACALRIAWAAHARHAPLAIAAQVFVSAGVVLLFVANLIFAQRVVRAARPAVGWHARTARAFTALYALAGATLAVVVAATVHSFYTLDARARRVDRALQLYGGTVFAIIAALPLVMLAAVLLLPLPPRGRQRPRPEKFGSGRWRTKLRLLAAGALLLTLGAAFRLGVAYRAPRPASRPAWYHSRACFYIFNFGLEAVVIYLYTFARVDRRFHVPNGASGPGQYAAGGPSSPSPSSSSPPSPAVAAAAVMEKGANANTAYVDAAATVSATNTTTAAPAPLWVKTDDHNSSTGGAVSLQQKEIV